MATTVQAKEVRQHGLWFNIIANWDDPGAGGGVATILDFSADLTDVVNGETYTAFKITKISGGGNDITTTQAQNRLEWDATANDVLMYLPGFNAVSFDFTKWPEGGILNPKSAGFTGDLAINIVGTASASMTGWVNLEGRLIP